MRAFAAEPKIGRRVLVLTAEVGEGHLAAAEALCAGLAVAAPEADVSVLDALSHVGRPLRFLLLHAYRWQLDRAPWLFDLLHRALMAGGGTGVTWRRLLYAAGGRRLRRAIDAADADLVVSTYPPATSIVGELRRRRRIAAPACATITDIGGTALWAHPDVLLHLVAHPSLAHEVERVAGAGSARAIRPLVRPSFYARTDRMEDRRKLGVDATRPLVIVSGGGWGIGDIVGAATIAAAIPRVQVVCLAGRNGALRRRLERRFKRDRNVAVLGFTDRMPSLLSAADVLVHSTGGVTVLEAIARGCPVVSYGAGSGHLRVVNRRMVELGLVRAARRETLRAVLEDTLEAGRAHPHDVLHLPDAAHEIARLMARPDVAGI